MLGTVNIQIANKEEIKNLMYSHNDAETIQNNTDLNTLLTPGKYRLLSDSFSISNTPNLDLGNFVMVVELFKTDVEDKYSILQRINTSDGNIATRQISVEGDTTNFSNWKINGELVLEKTLVSGNTSVTFTDSGIKSTSVIDVYTDTYGVNPDTISVEDGSATITFVVQENDVNVRISIK